ncbi:hypothetical protein K505DRAFT_88653 [Melanomma pulvis-pyrius CBS 109.77]|uniref:Uncharacterized protein n=1 Tax=Melanomma pulvis-pyrius CBS 109.77 TaxID=1314802 RepID=A0A6A6X0Y1_9PLEO|nr:hypothetical protein K505DRAFT_88653 [Melanomma pulvis-pyrius CBS 109.77]
MIWSEARARRALAERGCGAMELRSPGVLRSGGLVVLLSCCLVAVGAREQAVDKLHVRQLWPEPRKLRPCLSLLAGPRLPHVTRPAPPSRRHTPGNVHHFASTTASPASDARRFSPSQALGGSNQARHSVHARCRRGRAHQHAVMRRPASGSTPAACAGPSQPSREAHCAVASLSESPYQTSHPPRPPRPPAPTISHTRLHARPPLALSLVGSPSDFARRRGLTGTA